MKKNAFLFLFPLLFIFHDLPAQWQFILDGSFGQSFGFGLAALDNGGFAATGYLPPTQYKGLATVVDQNGKEVFSAFLDGADLGAGADILQASDGELIIIGTSISAAPDVELQVVKLKSNGEVRWTNNYGPYHSTGNAKVSADLTTDGKIIIAASTKNSLGLSSIMLKKIDSDGTLLWSKTSEDDVTEFPRSVAAFSDGSIIVTGQAFPGLGDPQGALLKKYDADGDKIWKKVFYDNASVTYGSSVVETPDGGIAVAAWRNYNGGNQESPIFKTDSQGNLLWETVLFYGAWTEVTDLSLSDEGGYVVCGWIVPNPSTPFMTKLDGNGNEVWSQVYDNLGNGKPYALVNGSDDGYTLAGFMVNGNARLWIANSDSEGHLFPSFINGSVFLDSDENCIKHFVEPKLAERMVQIEGHSSHFVKTDALDEFSVNTEAGEYEVSTLFPGLYWTTCPDPVTVTLDSLATVEVDVPVINMIECHLMEIELGTPLLRRSFPNDYTVYYCNNGTDNAEDVSVTLILDPLLDYNSSTIPFSTQSGNEIVFELGDVGPSECGSFKINVTVSCNAPLGLVHCVNAHISPDDLCGIQLPPGNDEPSHDQDCMANIGAYDPNDKSAWPRGEGAEHFIPADSLLNYHIRFQNTGTDTAFRVVVIDTLSSYLNLATFNPGASSHDYEWQLLSREDGLGTAVQFSFENIMLPDSNINEAASHGFVNFKINQIPGNQPGTFIENRAAIYFDFNAPVLTNTYWHTIEEPSFFQNIYNKGSFDVEVFPNPANDHILVEFDLPEAMEINLKLLDIFGRPFYVLSKKQLFQKGKHQIPIKTSSLQNGLYQVTFFNDEFTRSKNFVKI